MTRQAAPPVRRRLLLMLILLMASWLGQGVASAAGIISVDPASGGPGTTVNVKLQDFLDSCVVLFDDEVVAVGEGCLDATLSFEVPSSASVGEHELRAVGQAGDEIAEATATFTVTDGTPASTAPPTSAPPTSVAAGAPPGTSAPGVALAPPGEFAAACAPRQVALMRFDLRPVRAKAGEFVSASTTWGSVGTCTDVRPLLVLFDGMPVAGEPPAAGTTGDFRIVVPDDARAGSHQVTLVAADDESVMLSSLPFEVAPAESSTVPLVIGLAAGGLLLLLALVVVVRRRRRHRAFRLGRIPDYGPAVLTRDDDLWGGSLDVPDIAGPVADTRPTEAPVLAADEDPTMPVVPLVVASGRDGSYYLLERQNPNAPRADNGKRGWYRTQRTEAIRGIVVRTVEPHTAGAAASELATGAAPVSAHVVVDVDGPLELLPDDIVALHRPDLDDAVLVMLLAGSGVDTATDGLIRGHAAAWSRAKSREHGIPSRRVSLDAFQAGGSGLLSDDPDFPWHRLSKPAKAPGGLVDLTELVDLPPPTRPAPVDEPVGAGGSDPPDESPADDGHPLQGIPTTWGVATTASDAPEPDDRYADDPMESTTTASGVDLPAPPALPPPDAALPDVPATSPAPPVPPPPEPFAAPDPAVPPTTAAASPPDLLDPGPLPATSSPDELDTPVATTPPDVPVAPAVAHTPASAPAAPRPPRRVREQRPLPSPDELIAQASGATAYYLLEHENPNGTLRANGKHGWYYPTRYGGIRAVVLHRLGGDDDLTAHEVAAHLAAVTTPEAAHAVVDADTVIDLLPDDATALHGVRSSSAALDLALAVDPAGWGTDPSEEALLVRAATWAGVRAVRHRIPVRRITVDQWHTGERGFAAHDDIDPGADFPWDRFLQLTAWVARRVASRQPPPTSQPPANGPQPGGPPATGPSGTVRSGTPPT